MAPDGITAIEKSLANTSIVILGVIQELQSLQNLARTFGRQSARLNQNPFEANLRSKQLRIAEQFATEIDKSSPRIDKLALRLQKNCTELKEGFESYCSLNEIADAAERERVKKSLGILMDSKDGLIGTVEGLEDIRDQTDGFRKFLLDYVGEIGEIDTPLGSSSKSLSKLINELRHFHSLSTTIINRLH